MKHKRTCPERAEASRRIDPHVHPRPDIRSVALMAKSQGIGTILLMPSSSTEVLTEKDLTEKLSDLQKKKPSVRCFFYLKLTSDSRQIKEAVRLAKSYPEVVGLKIYPPENEKKRIFRILAQEDYTGVLAIHPEKESLFKPELFDPKKPWTHGLAQPENTETKSINEIIGFAIETNFRGAIYILHITLEKSAEIIWRTKKRLDIYSEVTPHHLLLSNLQMRGENGLLLKVNPPLRSRESVAGLLRAVKSGLVDCLGTDYAFHPLTKKLLPPYSSGIASYRLYGMALDYLRSHGLSERDIDNLTYWNIKKIFGDKLKDV